MIEMILSYYKSFPTVGYATAALLLISISAALLGVPLVLKRYSMIGDSLSHVTFGVSCIATALGLTSPIYISLPATILAAILLLRIRSHSLVGADSAIAMISSASLAFGYLFLNIFPSDDPMGDACEDLFGSGILAISLSDVIVAGVISLLVILLFVLFYNKIFAVTFDESFASASGVRVSLYNSLLAIMAGILIVISMEMVGALLISALIIFPALCAMRLYKSFRAVTLCAAILSFVCTAAGIIISLLLASPIGSTVVCVDVFAFALFSLIGMIRAK